MPADEEQTAQFEELDASWELPPDGFTSGDRRELIAFAFRLAALLVPGFPTEGAKQIVSRSSQELDYGGYASDENYTLGDAMRGLTVNERVTDPSDGMTPYSMAFTITAYGLPPNIRMVIYGASLAPMMMQPSQGWLKATLPAAGAHEVRAELSGRPGVKFSSG